MNLLQVRHHHPGGIQTMPSSELPASQAVRMLPSVTLSSETVMIASSLRVIALAVLSSLSLQSHAQMQTGLIRLESVTIGGNGTEILVRFDRPISHEQSWLSLLRDGKTVATLHPRLEAQPNVLFVRIHTPAKGNYIVRWTVCPEGSNDRYDGEFPFMVGDVQAESTDQKRLPGELSRTARHSD
jgi:hypothetical protein